MPKTVRFVANILFYESGFQIFFVNENKKNNYFFMLRDEYPDEEDINKYIYNY